MFDTWPDLRLNIDAKSLRPCRCLPMPSIRHRAFDRVCLAAFSHRSVRELRRRAGPRVATSFGRVEIGVSGCSRVVACGPSSSAPARSPQVPVRRGPLEIVTPGFISRMHEHGKQVHVWTIDEADEINRLLDLGVDGIFSDRIDVLKDTYVARGIWRG